MENLKNMLDNLIVSLSVGTLSVPLSAYVFTCLWAWFVGPILGYGLITFAQAIQISFVFHFVRAVARIGTEPLERKEFPPITNLGAVLRDRAINVLIFFGGSFLSAWVLHKTIS